MVDSSDRECYQIWIDMVLKKWFGTCMNFIFPYIGNFIIPTDELHHFSEG